MVLKAEASLALLVVKFHPYVLGDGMYRLVRRHQQINGTFGSIVGRMWKSDGSQGGSLDVRVWYAIMSPGGSLWMKSRLHFTFFPWRSCFPT
mmetsp:Transcript_65049/g.180907  ORF Transcript_65049/g.180907 Transcript_65049/m.180907 type:complete len:92 (-) Transcript_65049:571-846(-)